VSRTVSWAERPVSLANWPAAERSRAEEPASPPQPMASARPAAATNDGKKNRGIASVRCNGRTATLAMPRRARLAVRPLDGRRRFAARRHVDHAVPAEADDRAAGGNLDAV